MELSGVPEPRVIAMFPLGTVLFPHALLPLRVFEPRYRVMTERVLKADREFGVVLIERGSEVGGGDTRFDVGTVAQIVRVQQLGDGGYVLATVGIRRVRVAQWMPDDPYPQAAVVDFPEAEPDPEAAARAARARARDALEDVCAIYRQRDPRVPQLPPDAGDAVQASYELAALAPIGPLDAQRLLETPGAAARLLRLADLLEDHARVLRDGDHPE
jgi:Lon protease-like protein